MNRLTLHFNFTALNRQADQAMSRGTRQLGTAIQAGFKDPVYAWPGVTKRRSGTVAGTVRDVVDLGELRDSQTPARRVGPGHYEISWTADHAAAVFLGAVLKGRKGAMPARNVPMNVLRNFDFLAAVARAWTGP